MLEVSGVSASYGQHMALQRVDLEVRPGETVVILGANGAGKSTLLNTIAGLMRPGPDARISLAGRDLLRLPAHQVVEAGVALVPEGRGVFGGMTVRENLMLGAHARRARRRERENLDRVLALFPRLEERLTQLVQTMSGGEQQMVAVARALMSDPEVLLLDEPSLGLAPVMTAELFKTLRQLRDLRASVLMVEQNAHKSLAIADRGYLLETGCIVGSGDAEQLRGNPAVRSAYLGLST